LTCHLIDPAPNQLKKCRHGLGLLRPARDQQICLIHQKLQPLKHLVK
jgi:hypothetical protein